MNFEKMMTPEEADVFAYRHTRRREIFIKNGLDEDDAWDLADQLWNRDRDLSKDKRKVCFECSHFVGKQCAKKSEKFNPFVLQLCEKFQIKGKE